MIEYVHFCVLIHLPTSIRIFGLATIRPSIQFDICHHRTLVKINRYSRKLDS